MRSETPKKSRTGPTKAAMGGLLARAPTTETPRGSGRQLKSGYIVAPLARTIARNRIFPASREGSRDAETIADGKGASGWIGMAETPRPSSRAGTKTFDPALESRSQRLAFSWRAARRRRPRPNGSECNGAAGSVSSSSAETGKPFLDQRSAGTEPAATSHKAERQAIRAAGDVGQGGPGLRTTGPAEHRAARRRGPPPNTSQGFPQLAGSTKVSSSAPPK